MRLRPVKKWGNSLVIVLSPLDLKDLGIKLGDSIDIDDCHLISKNKFIKGGKRDEK